MRTHNTTPVDDLGKSTRVLQMVSIQKNELTPFRASIQECVHFLLFLIPLFLLKMKGANPLEVVGVFKLRRRNFKLSFGKINDGNRSEKSHPSF